MNLSNKTCKFSLKKDKSVRLISSLNELNFLTKQGVSARENTNDKKTDFAKTLKSSRVHKKKAMLDQTHTYELNLDDE